MAARRIALRRQQRRVLAAEGDLLVVGRPGTGKTTVALLKAKRMVESLGRDSSENVLFLSFSNAAVQRIRSAARIALPAAVRQRMIITTFHAFCYDLLRSHGRFAGITCPVQILFPEDVKVLKSSVTDAEELAKQVRRLERGGQVTFERFAPLVLDVLRRHRPIRAAYQRAFACVFVDEYQDTDDVQDELVNLLTENGTLVCLGDPEQRIFDFVAGTRADRLERLEARRSPTVIQLRRNHRSGGSDLIDYARAVVEARKTIARCEDVVVARFRKRPSFDKMLRVAIVSAEKRVREKRGRGRPLVAVMAYTNRFMGELSDNLRRAEAGFEPFSHRVMISVEDVGSAWDVCLLAFQSRDAAESAAQIMRRVARYDRARGSKTGLMRAERLERWAGELETSGKQRGKFVPQLVSRLEGLRPRMSGKPEDDVGHVRASFRGLPGGYLEQIVGLLELRPPAGRGESLGSALADLFGNTGSYAGAVDLGRDALLRERLTEGTAATSGRILLTMHKSKGKEYDAVVIVDWPHQPNRIVATEEDGKPEQPKSRRLLGVALTRARYCAVILTPAYDPCSLLPSIS